jgi:ankyrin repeat protein
MADVIGAIKAGDSERLRTLLADDPSRARARDENGVSALLLARYYGRLELVEILRSAAGELDVFEAAALGDSARLAELLDDDPELVNRYAPDGFTSLQLAAFFGHPDALDLLLERGAEVTAAAKNAFRVQALHSALAAGDNDADRATVARMAAKLIECGADVNARQQNEATPLHSAAFNGDADIAAQLLRAGADPAAANDAGKTPADVAAERGHEEVAALLRG